MGTTKVVHGVMNKDVWYVLRKVFILLLFVMINLFLLRSAEFKISGLVAKQCFILLEMMPSMDGMFLPLCQVITMIWFHPTREGTYR